jgi:hypothetical protein
MRSPEKTVITDPYPSVTTQDINIGIVQALVNETDRVYGVVDTMIDCPASHG